MIYISIQYKQYRNYTQAPDCIITGEAFYQDYLYSEASLLQLISSWDREEQLMDGLKQLNGFYALIKHTGQNLFAAVDRVRSIPLFYGQKGPDFFLSDSVEWIRKQIDATEMDPLARDEFLLTGYVTGSDTLFPSVKQLQAGEALFVQDDGRNIRIQALRYYRFEHKYETKKNMEELMEEHDQVLLRMFNRLIQLADGRTIIVPLSGGHDSRLIVLMLKRLGYKNVITFTYGRTGNKESEVSRKVAESLGLQWEFIEYNNSLWYKWCHSDDYSCYVKFASSFTSLPHIQDWPAVWHLKKENLIPEDSIFVPGHTGDFISGGHIPAPFGKANAIGSERLVDSILAKHYILHGHNMARDNQTILRNRIIGLCESDSLLSSVNATSAFEKWEWQERQAKFIVNSVRVYEFWNYQWWIPLWDYEYMQFWSCMPLEFRINQAMYKTFVDKLYFNSTFLKMHKEIHDQNHFINYFIRSFKSNSYLERVAQMFYRFYHKKIEYYTHPQACFGVVNKEYYDRYCTGLENINYLLALQMIEEVGRYCQS